MSDRSNDLASLAPILDGLRPDPNARLSYELMSDALIWSDELPPPDERDGLSTNCLRGVFRYRTTVILGNPEERFRSSWEKAKALCPNWPGFLPDRQVADAARIKLYEAQRSQLAADWEDLDARFEQQRKAKTEKAIA